MRGDETVTSYPFLKLKIVSVKHSIAHAVSGCVFWMYVCVCVRVCMCCESHLISAGLHSLWGCIGWWAGMLYLGEV